MSPARLILRASAFLAGMAIMLVLLEGVLRLAPVLNGAYAADPSAEWPLHTLISNSSYTYSHGWNAANIHRGRINNFGYVAPFDYRPGSEGIVVIGDSFVESMMNDYEDTLQGRLGRLLGRPENVMGFGMSGGNLAHYLGTAQIVRQHFAPQWAVIVIVAGDYAEGFETHPGFFRWAPNRNPPIQLVPQIRRSALQKLLRSLAIVRYVRGNLAIRLSQLIKLHRATDTSRPTAGAACVHQTLSPLDEKLTADYVDALPSVLGLHPSHVILVFDADHQAIYAGTTGAAATCPSVDALARNRLMRLATEHGMQVVDSFPMFQRYYISTHQHLDFLPLDGHWNAAAHRLVAQQVAQLINATGPPASPKLSHTATPAEPTGSGP